MEGVARWRGGGVAGCRGGGAYLRLGEGIVEYYIVV